MTDPIEKAHQRLVALLENVNNTGTLELNSRNSAMEDLSTIMEELRIAEEELRQQNEELSETRERISEERQRYRELFEFAPDAYLITDEKGLVKEANQAASKLFNVQQNFLSGKPILVYISEEDLTRFSRMLRSADAIRDVEFGVRPRHSRKVYVSVTTNREQGRNNQPAQIRWIIRDITERRKALAALDSSEQRFRTIFDQANLGIVVLDLKGMIVQANHAFQDMLGICAEEFPAHFFSLLDDPEDVEAITQAFQTVSRGQQSFVHQKTRLKGKDNLTVWAGIILSPLRSEQKRIQSVIAMVENISAEHQAEVELAEMRRRLLESGEAERLRLAQELHDGPMQDLYGAVFHLTNLPGLDSKEESLVHIKGIQDILKHVAGTLRTICGELRPPTLANLGLERAIRSHAEKIQELHPEINMDLQLTSEERHTHALPPHIRMALFRIYQQCMTNVLRHSQASSMMISFHVDESEAALDIWDNGKGFTLPEKWVELLREGHYGLAGIAERVDAMQGVLKIDTRPGAGTLVHVTVPVEKYGEE